MAELLKLAATLANEFHDYLFLLAKSTTFEIQDTSLHFWVIGLLGLTIYLVSDLLFRYLSRWGTTAITFIYTFTILLMVVFAIEIEQKITGRGTMSFVDVVAGLWGFIVLFGLYGILRLVSRLGRHLPATRARSSTLPSRDNTN